MSKFSAVLISLAAILGVFAFFLIEYAEVDAIYMLKRDAYGNQGVSAYISERTRVYGFNTLMAFLMFQIPTFVMFIFRSSKFAQSLLFLVCSVLIFGPAQQADYPKGDLHMCEFCGVWPYIYMISGLFILAFFVVIKLMFRLLKGLLRGNQISA